MAGLAEIVRRFAGHTGVNGAVVVSPDGLPIDHAGTVPDPDALAALTVTLLRPSMRFGENAGTGQLFRAVLEFDQGYALLTAVRGGHWLLVLARSDADIGTLLFDLRRDGPALASLL
ncbi:MAG TPA: roadblock/LC7 domain-containing protein [Gemmatimonadales bacterium]|nr:roadblock/LC7 domain-containing protein [Gemmatimonadales bacterium]